MNDGLILTARLDYLGLVLSLALTTHEPQAKLSKPAQYLRLRVKTIFQRYNSHVMKL
jgi:hypothetical protein